MEKLKKEKKTVVSSWIPESAIKRIEKIARKRKKTRCFIVSELILEGLEKQEEINQKIKEELERKHYGGK